MLFQFLIPKFGGSCPSFIFIFNCRLLFSGWMATPSSSCFAFCFILYSYESLSWPIWTAPLASLVHLGYGWWELFDTFFMLIKSATGLTQALLLCQSNFVSTWTRCRFNTLVLNSDLIYRNWFVIIEHRQLLLHFYILSNHICNITQIIT